MKPSQNTSFLRGTLRAIGAVGTAMVGLRRAQDREKDFATLKPVHVLVAGILIAAAIITALILLVDRIAG